MMDLFIPGAIFLGSLCAWFAAAFFTVFGDDFHPALRVLSGVACFVSLALLLGAIGEYEQKNPCVRYETRFQYNPAIKAMAPVRVCVERGEWVEQ